MIKFLIDHIIELLLAVIVSLLSYIARERLQNIEKEWSDLRSPITLMAVEFKMAQITEALLAKDLPDLTIADPTLCDLPVFISKFGPTLERSRDGQQVLNQLNCLREGLVAYINKEWNKAIDNFEKLDSNSSLKHRLLGAALFSKAEDTTNQNEANELRQQSKAHYISAATLATKERVSTDAYATILKLRARALQATKNAADNEAAIKAHLEIEQKGFANYNTFYNLAALYSRTGKNDDCLKYFRIYLDKGGKTYDKRSQPEGDRDFRDFIMISGSKDDFNALLSEMEP